MSLGKTRPFKRFWPALMTFFRVMSSGVHNIAIPGNIAALTVGVLLIPSFILWQRRQEKREKPTLIPNSLWNNRTFTTVCLLVIFSYAVVNAMEFFCSLL